MSILKSTKTGKSAIPITLNYLKNQGWKWATKKDPNNANRIIADTSKMVCDGHYLTIRDVMIEVDNGLRHEMLPIWTYHTHAYNYELVIKTIGDYEQVAEYFKVQKQNKKQRLKEALLKRPDIKVISNLWFNDKNGDAEPPKMLTKHHEGHIQEYIANLFSEPGTMIWEES